MFCIANSFVSYLPKSSGSSVQYLEGIHQKGHHHTFCSNDIETHPSAMAALIA